VGGKPDFDCWSKVTLVRSLPQWLRYAFTAETGYGKLTEGNSDRSTVFSHRPQNTPALFSVAVIIHVAVGRRLTRLNPPDRAAISLSHMNQKFLW